MKTIDIIGYNAKVLLTNFTLFYFRKRRTKMALSKKTEQMLAYIIKNFPGSTVTSLMKLSYLIDLVNVGRAKQQISNFTYRKYFFGPFDKNIYPYLTSLITKEIIFEKSQFSSSGDEYIVYDFNEDASDYPFSHLREKDICAIDEVLTKLVGYGAKALTDVTYKTKPMKKVGAIFGDRSNLNVPLDLRAK